MGLKYSLKQSPKTINLAFHHDPGHGWLEVYYPLVKALNVEISRYSYRNGNLAYLEEDCDATAFLQAAETAGFTVKIRDKYYDSSSFIRELPSITT